MKKYDVAACTDPVDLEEWVDGVLSEITDEQILALDAAGWKIIPKDHLDQRQWPFGAEDNEHLCPGWCRDQRHVGNGKTYKSWAELFPSGCELCFEGKNEKDRKAFIAEMKSKFDFDPSRDRGWCKGSGWRFHCPPDLLDKIFRGGHYRLGS